MNIKEVNATELQATQSANNQEISRAARRAARWGWWLPLLAWLAFSLLYAGFAFWQANSIDLAASLADQAVVGETGYRWYLGVILGAASTAGAYFLYALAWLLRLWRHKSWRIILAAGAYGPWLYLSWQLLRGGQSGGAWPLLQIYAASPLFSASAALLVMAVLWLIGRWLIWHWRLAGTKLS